MPRKKVSRASTDVKVMPFSPTPEEKLAIDLFDARITDWKTYFEACIKPRNDRAYKLYMSYAGDRWAEIQRTGQTWRANTFVPYTQGTVETLIPRVLDARPDLGVRGRTPESKAKAFVVSGILDWAWDKNVADEVMEEWVRSCLIYGISWLYLYWKVDEKGKRYDYPAVETVDNYSFVYDWRNVPHKSKQFKGRRRILTEEEVLLRMPDVDEGRLRSAMALPRKRDVTDYGRVRYEIRTTHQSLSAFSARAGIGSGAFTDRYTDNTSANARFHETFEMWYPMEGIRSFWVDGWPVKYEEIPDDGLEDPFIDLAYLRPPFEYEGWGIPLILESTQLSLNTLKNQRQDAGTMAVLKMFIVSPNAGVKKEALTVRPFGIIWSSNPDAVKPIDFGDVPASSYREEELLKADMRFATGIDDASMGVSGSAGSATEQRHLRESTLERVRLFINHLGNSLTRLQMGWLTLLRKYLSVEVAVEVTDEKGLKQDQIVTKDDLRGEFDLQATVSPSIVGKEEVEKKQGMDLLSVLMPLVEPAGLDVQKIISFALQPFRIPLEKIRKDEAPAQAEMPPEQGMPASAQEVMGSPGPSGIGLPNETLLALKSGMGQQSSNPGLPPEFQGATGEVNPAANPEAMPPTAPDTTRLNQTGLNRVSVAKVNTDLPGTRGAADVQSQVLNKASSLQLKK